MRVNAHEMKNILPSIYMFKVLTLGLLGIAYTYQVTELVACFADASKICFIVLLVLLQTYGLQPFESQETKGVKQWCLYNHDSV